MASPFNYVIFLFVFLLFNLGCSNIQTKVNPVPNIIFIMTDDMGYETVGFNGATNYKTPNIDKLAGESFVFTNCDAQPLCCPTRIKLMTGQYNYRNYTGWGSFNLEFPAIAKVLKDSGYVTGVFGKWHMNKSPQEMGFDEHCLFSGSPGKLPYSEFFKRYYYNAPLIEDNSEVNAPYAPDKFNQRVLKFIESYKSQPFFIYYPLSLAHNPFEPTPDSKDKTSGDWQANFEDMVAYSDKMIGNVIQKLKETKLYENTIIFYTSDNGTKTLAHEMNDGSVVYGGKGTHTVDGCHVPLTVKWDGRHKILDDLVDFTDFHPTLANLAGVPTSNLSNKLDGVSFLPLLNGESRDDKPYIFSVYFHPLSAYIRGKEFKYYLDGRLYNLGEDPRETMPYYQLNDTEETGKARYSLISHLTELLEQEEYAKYPARQKLEKKFGDYQKGPDSLWLIKSFIIDNLEYTPRTEILHCDLTPYIDNKSGEYMIRVSRSYDSKNSGLTYADAVIKRVKLTDSGQPIFDSIIEQVELTTRIDTDMLRKKGNPIIAFKKAGDLNEIPLGTIRKPETGKIELKLTTELSNPGNQWGDRIRLYVFLEKI